MIIGNVTSLFHCYCNFPHIRRRLILNIIVDAIAWRAYISLPSYFWESEDAITIYSIHFERSEYFYYRNCQFEINFICLRDGTGGACQGPFNFNKYIQYVHGNNMLVRFHPASDQRFININTSNNRNICYTQNCPLHALSQAVVTNINEEIFLRICW